MLEQICQRLYGWLHKNPVLQGRTVYVCDGSTLRLPHSPELAKFYPPHSNQDGGSHWPFLRIVVLQDVKTGLAMMPQWGKETENEQSLAVHAIAALPAGAVVIGDRNLGIFGVAFAASRCAHDVIVRLTKVRAERLAGRGIEPGYDRNLTWRPSRWDQCGGPYTADASVSGRLICIPAADPNHTEAIYLFTTLEIPVNQISNLYAQRWNVETDLRSIKQTVRLQEFSARSVTGLHNELLLAFAAYNLVRAMMCLAAAKANVPPRKISFTNVYALLRTFAGDIYAHRHASCHAPLSCTADRSSDCTRMGKASPGVISSSGTTRIGMKEVAPNCPA